MPTALEVTKRYLYADAYNRYDIDDMPIEDCKFLNFTEFLDEIDIFKNPTVARSSGLYKNGKWSLLGFSVKTFREENEDLDIDIDEEINTTNNHDNSFTLKWEYTLFNGVFSDDNQVKKTPKLEIEKCIKETARFLEKTLSNDFINDVNEARELQQQILKQHNQDNLDLLEICIISDNIIDIDKLPEKVKLKNIDLECRIKYWDIKRWNDLKRSKSKRESINIDLKSETYNLYDIPFVKKEIRGKMTYYLSIFPGDLIADLYETYNTSLLENNVRVFLSATRKANKAIRQTIGSNSGEDAHKFFSYNNGISATAEKIEIENGKILKIKDFQIVNGGQTTATIHYSRRRDKYSLKDVFIAVKITELKKSKEYSSIVNKISQAANTQSAVSESDFFANDKMLVEIEKLSAKNPIQTDDERNIFYFFERMKGQFNVSKLTSGTGKNQQRWLETHPKPLMFDKIDLARWANMMEELPHIAATGAQKQFKDYMNNKNFQREDINFNNYKDLIGLGLLFKRIKKLCGTSSGKVYPSLTIDPITKTHAPVAMSTAIYTTALIHKITSGQLDYWGFYDYEYMLAKAINSKDRINSDLDLILEKLIKLTWNQIAKYGGAAAQEKTKTLECWNFVKSNISISDDIYKKLKQFSISVEEKTKRSSFIENSEDSDYFEGLSLLLNDGGIVLQKLQEIASTNGDFISEKRTISNFIKKIQRGLLLPMKRVEEIKNFHELLIGKGFKFELNTKGELIKELSLSDIYNKVFKNKDLFLEKLYESCFDDEVLFDENEKKYSEIKDIIEKYYREYGLSIEDIYKLNS